MQNHKVSTEEIARQLAGISHILDSIAEEATVSTKAKIQKASQSLLRIATPGTGLPVPGNGKTGPHKEDISFSGNSHRITREFECKDFQNLEIDCAFIFEVKAAETYSVSINASESLFDNVSVVQSGDTLRLSLKPGRFDTRPILEARISMPTINRLRQSAATKGAVNGFRSNNPFDLYLSGASSVDLDIEAGEARLEVSGASRLSGSLNSPNVDILLSGASKACLGGSCQNLSLSAWGAAELDLSRFCSQEGVVYLKGASQAMVMIAKRLDIDLTGASYLQYAGSPVLSEISMSGASVLTRCTS